MDKQTYWFITYSWARQDSTRILESTVHHGSMWAWIDDALDQPESWILLNQVEIDKSQFLALKERF